MRYRTPDWLFVTAVAAPIVGTTSLENLQDLIGAVHIKLTEEEVKALEEDIEAVKAKVDDPVLCEKIKRFVDAPREIQDTFKADSSEFGRLSLV